MRIPSETALIIQYNVIGRSFDNIVSANIIFMVQYISYTCHKEILHPGKKMCNTVTFAIALGYNWVSVVIKVLSTNFLVFYWKYPIERLFCLYRITKYLITLK
jgi:hypothetical protein